LERPVSCYQGAGGESAFARRDSFRARNRAQPGDDPFRREPREPPAGTPTQRLDAALARLEAALGQLESAVSVRLEDDLSTSELDEELAIMQDDRARLALELDDALARVSALEKAREEVLRRLDAAEAGVMAALDAAAGGRDEEE